MLSIQEEVWTPAERGTFGRSLAVLFASTEKAGCQFAEGVGTGAALRRYEVRFPGQDAVLLLDSPVQSFFWDRADLLVDKERGQVRCRWHYGSPGQLVLHGLVTLMVFVSARPGSGWVSAFLAVLGNALLAAFSWWERRRLRSRLSSAGFLRQGPA